MNFICRAYVDIEAIGGYGSFGFLYNYADNVYEVAYVRFLNFHLLHDLLSNLLAL